MFEFCFRTLAQSRVNCLWFGRILLQSSWLVLFSFRSIFSCQGLLKKALLESMDIVGTSKNVWVGGMGSKRSFQELLDQQNIHKIQSNCNITQKVQFHAVENNISPAIPPNLHCWCRVLTTSHFRKLCDLLFIFLDLLSILTDFQQWAVHFILASCFDFFQFFLVQIVQEILKLTTKKNISNQFTNNQQITNQALLK